MPHTLSIRMFLFAALTAALGYSSGALAQAIVDELISPPVAPAVEPTGSRDELPIDELQPAWIGKEPVKSDGQISPGIKLWSYSPMQVERLYLRLNATTYIYFPEWEVIESFVVGDPNFFEVRFETDPQSGRPLRKNVVLVTAINNVAKADTTLHVTGSLHNGRRNVYSAWLATYPKKSQTTTDVTVIVQAPTPQGAISVGAAGDAATGEDKRAAGEAAPASTGARDPSRPDANAEAPEDDFLREIKFDYANMKFGTYEIRVKDAESETIAPVRVMEDGYFTFIDFGENGRSDRILRPNAWRVIDGVDNLVNTRTVGPKGNILVVEGTGYNITLRNGERVVCLIYTGTDVLPGSGRTAQR